MTNYSDEAMALSGDICSAHIYPLVADLVAIAQRYCAWEKCELSDDQVEQITRASIHACDGIGERICGAIDMRRAFGMLEGLSDA